MRVSNSSAYSVEIAGALKLQDLHSLPSDLAAQELDFRTNGVQPDPDLRIFTMRQIAQNKNITEDRL